jgi:glycosyltransferase involved in cell wall biosynthesis
MKIAMMVHGYLPVPRPTDMIYAPIDLAVALAEGLAKRGHDIDFYAPLNSELKLAKIKSLNMRALVNNNQEFQELLHDPAKMSHYVPELWDRYFVNEMFAKSLQGDYDLLHFHHPEAALPSAQINADIPTVYTHHDPIYPWYKELYELYQTPNQHFVSISNNQRRDAPDLQYAATIYNGVDVKKFPFSAEPEDYLLFAGRIVPEKGVKEAVKLAQETNNRLLIIGPVYPDQQGYFDQYIKPHLNDKILYLGYIEQAQLVRYYQKAKAFLMPIQWEEPFGLTMIESMACGTPVLALNRGAVAEIVEDGVTGFVLDCLSDMAAAIEKISTIDRAACRNHVKKHFSIEKMVNNYEAAFLQLIDSRPKRLTKSYVKTRLRRALPAAAQKSLKPSVKTLSASAKQLNLTLQTKPKLQTKTRPKTTHK